MRSPTTLLLFAFVVVLTAFSVIAVWPSEPERYLPGDFWPSGRGIKIGGWERETMRLGLDLRGGTLLVVEADPPDDYQGNIEDAMDTAKEVIEKRVNAFGTSEAIISKAGSNRLQVEIPGMSVTDAQNLIGKTAQLEFRVFDDQGNIVPAQAEVDGELLTFTGQYLKNNTYPQRQGTEYVVVFETTSKGRELLRKITSQAVQFPKGSERNLLLIYLDDQLISAPAVQSVLDGGGVITGQKSFSEARDFSKQLNAGALPVPLRTIQASEVSATLGDQSVVDSVEAGEIGLIAVALFMILYYRLPGLLAAAALGVYTSVTLMIFKLGIPGGEPITLTLSGIAAFVLSVGMAVDANILIFERMKEELRRGHTLNRAIDLGFARAWTSIRDSNISTFITCAILYWFGDQFGASLVKGFALTLAIGVAVSMFSAITVSRTFLKMVVGTPLARSHWLFNAEEQKKQSLPAGRTAGSTGG
ncbi:MAG: protein translocase subunit SecD [Hyphomicrobiales bacterium]